MGSPTFYDSGRTKVATMANINFLSCIIIIIVRVSASAFVHFFTFPGKRKLPFPVRRARIYGVPDLVAKNRAINAYIRLP